MYTHMKKSFAMWLTCNCAELNAPTHSISFLHIVCSFTTNNCIFYVFLSSTRRTIFLNELNKGEVSYVKKCSYYSQVHNLKWMPVTSGNVLFRHTLTIHIEILFTQRVKEIEKEEEEKKTFLVWKMFKLCNKRTSKCEETTIQTHFAFFFSKKVEREGKDEMGKSLSDWKIEANNALLKQHLAFASKPCDSSIYFVACSVVFCDFLTYLTDFMFEMCFGLIVWMCVCNIVEDDCRVTLFRFNLSLS